MPGELGDILPNISEAEEKLIEELIYRKMKGYAGLAVRLLHTMEKRFGPEARDVLREMTEDFGFQPRPDPGDPSADLHELCDSVERACIGTHRWERVIDEPDRIGYHFTDCMHARIFKELGEPDLGFLFCAGDEPHVKSYNPALGFRRTKTLMQGDEVCDHIYLVEKHHCKS